MKPYHKNPRQITERQFNDLTEWLDELGDLSGIVHDLNSDEVPGGNQRGRVFDIFNNGCEIILEHEFAEPNKQGTVGLGYVLWQGNRYAYRQVRWTPEQCEKANIVANKAGGTFDFEILANEFNITDLVEWGFEPFELGIDLNENGAGKDTPPDIDKAEQLREKWGVKIGDLWRLGPHRLVCGDCTDKPVVERVMGGERSVLCHADPPYGMGKENEGIANDNLYREKLDAFQMQWWGACRPFIEDNGSVYIWGNAEDLWRLWYVGGLNDSERLTFRNEIVWNKESGQGMLSDAHRMYPTGSERCFFFMLGEQGFNNNADNYWEGWEPIRSYLKGERDKMGWDNSKCKTLAGHSPTSGCHWFDSSQWGFVTEDVYNAWKQAANGLAFRRDYDELKRDYDELKRDFYATRAYFDNTHDNMTDVWNFSRVQGEERWEHATPKPVQMIERIIKSSSSNGAIIYSPFLGSGTDLIAAHNLDRRARCIELDPSYCAVTLQRFLDHTGITPSLIE